MGADQSKTILFYSLDGSEVTPSKLFVPILTFIVGVAIIILNSIILDTFRRYSNSMHDTSGYFIANLAVADTLTGIFVLYNTLYNVLLFKNAHECLFRFGMLQAFNITSVLTLAALTLDRYIKIVNPYIYETHLSEKSEKLTIMSIWIISILVGILPLMGWHQDYTGDICSYFGLFTTGYLVTVVILFFIPLLLMVGLYAHLIHISKKHARHIAAQSGDWKKQKNNATWKSTKTVFIIIGAYFICWGPLGFYIIVCLSDLQAVSEDFDKGLILGYIAPVAFSNSLINPIIYALKIPEIRDRFQSLCCRSVSKEKEILCTYPIIGNSGNGMDILTIVYHPPEQCDGNKVPITSV